MEYIPGILILLIGVGGGIWAYFSEKKAWNGGTNPVNNNPWKHFDTDSQGGRGYNDSEGTYIWISWPVDK